MPLFLRLCGWLWHAGVVLMWWLVVLVASCSQIFSSSKISKSRSQLPKRWFCTSKPEPKPHTRHPWDQPTQSSVGTMLSSKLSTTPSNDLNDLNDLNERYLSDGSTLNDRHSSAGSGCTRQDGRNLNAPVSQARFDAMMSHPEPGQAAGLFEKQPTLVNSGTMMYGAEYFDVLSGSHSSATIVTQADGAATTRPGASSPRADADAKAATARNNLNNLNNSYSSESFVGMCQNGCDLQAPVSQARFDAMMSRPGQAEQAAEFFEKQPTLVNPGTTTNGAECAADGTCGSSTIVTQAEGGVPSMHGWGVPSMHGGAATSRPGASSSPRTAADAKAESSLTDAVTEAKAAEEAAAAAKAAVKAEAARVAEEDEAAVEDAAAAAEDAAAADNAAADAKAAAARGDGAAAATATAKVEAAVAVNARRVSAAPALAAPALADRILSDASHDAMAQLSAQRAGHKTMIVRPADSAATARPDVSGPQRSAIKQATL